ncbi:pentapeptide repeat-containing protein [Streptomyces sp. NPDC059943]|uniref:pentapeptide repeat-containing protein n=1 Tax=Streptomyces sp. NPDC059943 TaxID=3347010 RepID=UPI003663BDF3
MVAAVVAVVGLWYSNVQIGQANEQVQQANAQARDDRALVKEGQTTDRYTAAVGNLGEDKMDVGLGGIYALERIMKDSARDQPTIANVLATYIRTHAATPPAKDQGVPADVHAALTVLANRDTTHDENFRLDLRHVQLPRVEVSPPGSLIELRPSDSTPRGLAGANLYDANLTEADLSGMNLSGVNLPKAKVTEANLLSVNLVNTDLAEADLTRANLFGADLTGAYLAEADLVNTDLSEVDLANADLGSANLTEANLKGADLTGATILTREQVESAYIDGKTKLPAGFS